MADTAPEAAPWAGLAAQWRAASRAPLHLPGCGCAMGFLPRLPAAAELEADLLEMLRHRYAAQGRAALAALLAAREAAAAPAKARAMAGGAAGGGAEFGDWLAGLGTAGLAEADAARLAADLARALDSLAPRRGGGLRCI